MGSGQRAENVTLIAAAGLTVATGTLMRAQLVTPDASPTMVFIHAAAWGVHLLVACLALCMPLALVILERLLAREAGDPRARVDARLRWAAVISHAATLALIVPAIMPVELPPVWVLAAPLAIVVVILRTVLIARALLGTARRPSPLLVIASALTAGATLVFGLPIALHALTWLAEPAPGLFAPSFEALVADGLPIVMTPVGVALGLALARGTQARTLGLALLVVIAAAWAAAALIPRPQAQDLLGLFVDDGYGRVGVGHALLVAPMAAFLYHATLPRRPQPRLARHAWIGLALLAAACVAEVALGAHGMPRGYAAYDPAFTTHQIVTTLAWLAALVHLAVWLLAAARSRRADIEVAHFE
ncbi:MAG: hypothetical protein IT385_22335 [Deltaproteobacteria bacterium]|nr:hypothetical protein [Deltaproteobacteria bacterium]